MRKHTKIPYFKDLSRKDYVVQAGKIIKEEGVKAVSIRRLATELGCSSASMYRYFKNLDELLYYAQLESLNSYILDLSEQEKVWKDSWDIYFGIWRCYASEAFRNPEAFDCIFYRNINKNLGKALKEYYEMFPDTIVRVSPLIKRMLETPEYYERDYLICRFLIEEGILTEGNAEKLNHLMCTLFLGYFKLVQMGNIKAEELPALVDQYIRETKGIVQIYAPSFVPVW